VTPTRTRANRFSGFGKAWQDAQVQAPQVGFDVEGRLLDALPQVAFTLDRDGRVRRANPAAVAFLGRPRADVVGVPLGELLLTPAERGSLEDVLSIVLAGGRWGGEMTLSPQPGNRQQAALLVRPVRDASGEEAGTVVGALVLLTEPNGERPAEHLTVRLNRLARVAAELVLADDLEAVTRIVVEHMADAAGATVSSLSLLVDPDTLALVGVRGGREGIESRWATYSVNDRTPAGEAVREGRIVTLTGRAEIRSRYPDLETAAEGERSIVCLPLRIGDRVLGAASMSYPGTHAFTPGELEFLAVMADTCAQAIERVRLSAEAADRSAKLQFLADASVELSAGLDYETTLAKVARLAVPWFADWCAISLLQEGELRTLAVAHVDPQKVELAEELQRRFPPDPAAPHGSYQVLRSGRSELIPEITEEMITAAVTDPEQLRLVHELNLRSSMVVPLKVQDGVLGVVTWVAGDRGRRFAPEDLAFGEDLAHRAAVAIANAQLHGELSDVAVRLQRAVLPAELPALPGWEAAASYLQAGDSEAGGDFYDVTPLGDGRLAMFVGDVMGRGVTAATAMAQMRAAIRALVTVEPEPTTVLRALDRLFEQYDFRQLVTLVYVVADPARDEIVVASAGHPPPVVRRRDGSVDVVAGEPGLLLGAGGEERTTITVPFCAGDLLLCYTDGLVERRDEDIETGVERLAAVCADSPHSDLFTWLADVVVSVRDVRRDDDVAVVALRRNLPELAG
jgi:GAF domain-containing protein